MSLRSAKPPVARPAFLPKEGPPGLPGAKGAEPRFGWGKVVGWESHGWVGEGLGGRLGVEWLGVEWLVSCGFFWFELDEVG